MAEVTFHLLPSQLPLFEVAIAEYGRFERTWASTSGGTYAAKTIELLSQRSTDLAVKKERDFLLELTLSYEDPVQLLHLGLAMGAVGAGIVIEQVQAQRGKEVRDGP